MILVFNKHVCTAIPTAEVKLMRNRPQTANRTVNILLVEDNPADVLLTMEALKEGDISHELNVVTDGADAIAYLRRKGKYTNVVLLPDIILLDINLPKKNGFEVLSEIKEDQLIKSIPVIILTTSSAKQDIRKAYDLHANCYIVKPLDFDAFLNVVRSIEDFWLTLAKLPRVAS
jgi:chemotaxis family two-component system response regulator Rcp1